MSFDYRELSSQTRERLREWQDERLQALLRELTENRFYHEKFQQAGLEMAKVHRVADLSELPFTTKAELAADQQEYSPYGRLLSYPLSQYRY